MLFTLGMKAKEMDQKFQEGAKLWNAGKSQECANIWMDLADLGHLDSIEQLVYIFLDQKEFEEVARLIDCAKNPNEPIILYLKARLIEERDGVDAAMDSFKTAAEAGNPNAISLMFRWAIQDCSIDEAEDCLEKLKIHKEFFAHPGMSESFDDLQQQLDDLKSGEKPVDGVGVNVDLRTKDVIHTISIKDLTILKKYKEKDLNNASNLLSSFDSSIRESAQNAFTAGNSKSRVKDLSKILKSGDQDAINLAVLNPQFSVKESASYFKEYFQSVCEERFSKLNQLSDKDFSDNFNMKRWGLVKKDYEDAKALLQYMQGDDLSEATYEHLEENAWLIFDSSLVVSMGNESQKKSLQKSLPNTYAFVEHLKEKNLLDPYIFWTLEPLFNTLNREIMLIENDSAILALEDALFDPASIDLLQYPGEFKPLGNVSEDWIINIESGSFAVTSKVPTNGAESYDLESCGFETGSGLGDGYYPTIPFFDAYGNLQNITTFFTHMMGSEHLDSNLGSALYFSRLFENRIPIKLGFIKSKGSIYFGDASIIENDEPARSDIVLEFRDLPIDEYLVVAYVDTAFNDEVFGNQRTWAVSVLRDRAKRNYEILFEIFPELTNRQNDF
jgi:hypothetical protein